MSGGRTSRASDGEVVMSCEEDDRRPNKELAPDVDAPGEVFRTHVRPSL